MRLQQKLNNGEIQNSKLLLDSYNMKKEQTLLWLLRAALILYFITCLIIQKLKRNIRCSFQIYKNIKRLKPKKKLGLVVKCMRHQINLIINT